MAQTCLGPARLCSANTNFGPSTRLHRHVLGCIWKFSKKSHHLMIDNSIGLSCIFSTTRIVADEVAPSRSRRNSCVFAPSSLSPPILDFHAEVKILWSLRRPSGAFKHNVCVIPQPKDWKQWGVQSIYTELLKTLAPSSVPPEVDLKWQQITRWC